MEEEKNECTYLHLAKMRRITQHVNVHQLGYVSVTELFILILDGCADERALGRDDTSFFSSCLTGTHSADQIP